MREIGRFQMGLHGVPCPTPERQAGSKVSTARPDSDSLSNSDSPSDSEDLSDSE